MTVQEVYKLSFYLGFFLCLPVLWRLSNALGKRLGKLIKPKTEITLCWTDDSGQEHSQTVLLRHEHDLVQSIEKHREVTQGLKAQ